MEAKNTLKMWKKAYFDIRAKIEASGREARWEFDRKRLFERTDYMATICQDLYDVLQVGRLSAFSFMREGATGTRSRNLPKGKKFGCLTVGLSCQLEAGRQRGSGREKPWKEYTEYTRIFQSTPDPSQLFLVFCNIPSFPRFSFPLTSGHSFLVSFCKILLLYLSMKCRSSSKPPATVFSLDSLLKLCHPSSWL